MTPAGACPQQGNFSDMATVTHGAPSVDWEIVDLVPPELVDPFADDDRPGLAALEHDAPEPSDAGLSLADWLDVQASYYLSRPGSGSAWLGARIREWADLAVRHRASTPAQLDERVAMEEEA